MNLTILESSPISIGKENVIQLLLHFALLHLEYSGTRSNLNTLLRHILLLVVVITEKEIVRACS